MVNSEFLSTIPIFSSLSAPAVDEIASNLTMIDMNANDIIFKKGDPANSLYIIQEGAVKIMLKAFDGEDLTLTVLKNTEMFGELTLFDNDKRTATAIAAENTKLLEMPRATFIDFLKRYPDIAINLLSLLGTRLRNTNDIIERQVTRNANDEIEHELTFGDKLSDKVAEFIGSWTFIIIFLSLLLIWISLNSYALVFKPVDHYPFILLNLILSCLAAFQAPVIMMSQGRQAKKDHIAADLDYKINLRAEWQIEEILIRLDKISNEEIIKTEDHTQLKNEIIQIKNEIMEKLEQVLKQPKG